MAFQRTVPDALDESKRLADPVELVTTYLQRFTGGQFDRLARQSAPDRIEATDLVAVTMLSVRVPPRAAAFLLGDGADAVTRLLRAIPSGLYLEDALDDHLHVATELWNLLTSPASQVPADRKASGLGPVTAGKLLATKREEMIPIYDKVVSEAVGYRGRSTWWSDWQDELRAHRDLRTRAAAIRSQAARLEPEATHLSDLRVFDIVLWMTWRPGGPGRMRS